MTRDRLPILALALAIGLLGSFTDDLLGSSLAVTVLQVALWLVSAAIALTTLAGSRDRDRDHGHRPRGLSRTAA
jgi:hypothetical protein